MEKVEPKLSGNDDDHRQNKTLEQVSNRSLLKLRHIRTNRRLPSHHNIKAPVSDVDWQLEVTAYGADGYPGDVNDVWILEIVSELSEAGQSTEVWQTIRSVVRLKHASTGCYLFSRLTKLPKWGYEQQVSCSTHGKFHKSLWFVETNYSPYDQSIEDFVNYRKPNLGEKFV